MQLIHTLTIATLAVIACVSGTAQAAIDADLLAGLKARAIGPAATSGRITDIEAVESNPNIIYAATATGGLWKSINAGLNWQPIFDDQDYASIGAIAINQQNPNIIWVGTGEGNTRNSTSYGGGMYKSLDGGKSWHKVGLAGTERINRIALHPSNPDIAYVAALGTLWSENEERGLYKTTDGGKSWEKILYVDEKTGATDIKMHPSNPNKLYAAMWQFRRWPFRFESGGPGSGLYISNDGGNSWERKTEDDGLPGGDLGRMVIAVSRSNPERIYTLVEAEDSALVRSDDGGHSWQKVNTEKGVADRPFYYSELEVDPNNDNIVYNIATRIRRSIDGGKNFDYIHKVTCCATGNYIHIDSHSLWLNPADSDHLILGNDGGIAISRDMGDTWRFVQNLPVSQFYHVRVDNGHPYNIYGGLQDNGSWRGPAEVWNDGGIRNLHWQEIGFGDGFDAMPYPDNNNIGYAMSQGGALSRWNLETGQENLIRPNPPLDKDGQPISLRFNWNAGLAQDPFDNDTIYYGSQFVHMSNDRGESWQTISADLTTNNNEWQRYKDSGGITSDVTAAENFTSIVTIAPSPVQQGVIWVGTDDGRIHITRDGGKSWKSLEKKLRGVPKNTWVPHIEPSHFDPGSAYIVLDNHRRGDMQTYVYKAEKFGSKFRNLSKGKGLKGYALSIQQDHVDPKLLFLGTELGLYVSTNGGEDWFKFTQGVPTVSVMDMDIQTRENDLVLGTHGRSIFVIDDYRALRGLSDKSFKAPLSLLSITDGQSYNSSRAPGTRFWGDAAYVGPNEPKGVMLTVLASGEHLAHPNADKDKVRKQRLRAGAADKANNKHKDQPSDKARIEVRDSQGNLVRTFVKTLHQGINRIVWGMNRDGVRPAPGNEPKEDKDILPATYFEVLPGEYDIAVSLNGHKVSGKARVLADPRENISDQDRRSRMDTLMALQKLEGVVVDMRHAIDKAEKNVRQMQKRVEAALAEVPKSERKAHPLSALKEQGKAVLNALKQQHKQIRTLPDTVGIVDSSYTLSSKLATANWYVVGNAGAPSPAAMGFVKIAREATEARAEALNQVLQDKLGAYTQAFRQSDVSLLPDVAPISI